MHYANHRVKIVSHNRMPNAQPRSADNLLCLLRSVLTKQRLKKQNIRASSFQPRSQLIVIDTTRASGWIEAREILRDHVVNMVDGSLIRVELATEFPI